MAIQSGIVMLQTMNGAVGTGIFRALEILKGLKDGKLNQRPEVFSKAADVYSFGMTYYEILTGKLPFGDHSQSDYDLVINGERLVVPEYVEDWTHELLSRCWQSNPQLRPTFGEILDVLVSNSTEAREDNDALERIYREYFQMRQDTEVYEDDSLWITGIFEVVMNSQLRYFDIQANCWKLFIVCRWCEWELSLWTRCRVGGVQNGDVKDHRDLATR